MRIVFIGGNFGLPGGTERVSSIIANNLSLSYDVHIISLINTKSWYFDLNSNVNLHGIINENDFRAVKYLSIISELRSVIRKIKPDVIISVETMITLFTIPATIGMNIKHIDWEHFNFNVSLGNKIRTIFRYISAYYCDAVVTLTDSDKKLWIKRTKTPRPIFAIPNPLPFTPENNYNPDSKLILAIGRLVPQKGFDILLEAWSITTKKNKDWHLSIIGDGPDRDYLIALTHKLGISNRVTFSPATSDIRSHYKKAGIFCLSSRFEGFGMVLIEAMANGIPSISFNCEFGPSDILKNTSAPLVENGNINNLSNELLHLIDNMEKRIKLSDELFNKSFEYTESNIVPKWHKVLNAIVFPLH